MTRAKLRAVTLLGPSRHDSTAFDCGDARLNRWLQRTAPTAAASGTAATWVLCRSNRIVGYYALAMGSVDQHSAPSRLGRGQPDPVPVLVLARLALDVTEHGQGLGADLLRDALLRSLLGGHHFGARAVVVDPIDESAASFYSRYGFLPLDRSRLYRRMSDLQRSAMA